MIKFVRRLFRNTDGQVSLYVIFFIVAVLAFMLAIPNVGQVTTQRMRAQTAADAGAYTTAVWLARALNLNANINRGVKSMYAWMAMLTPAEALALALNNDSLDASVKTLGGSMTLALFGNSGPGYVHANIYPQSIQKIGQTAQYLNSLQSDITTNFPGVSLSQGANLACQNVSAGNPSSQNPGGVALVQTNDSMPPSVICSLFVTRWGGDSVTFSDLRGLANSLQTIPTGDSNVGTAHGTITVDTLTSYAYEVTANYGDTSLWQDVWQRIIGQDWVEQYYESIVGGVIYKVDSATKFVEPPYKQPWAKGDSWVKWWYHHPNPWYWYYSHPGNNATKIDTMIRRKHHYIVGGLSRTWWNWKAPRVPGDSILAASDSMCNDYNGLQVDSSWSVPTGFYTGAESTKHQQGPRIRPPRLDPNAGLCAVSYVWWLGGSANPYGLSPSVGGSLFPRGQVAPPSPLLAVSEAVPYLAMTSPTTRDYYFNPVWNARLAPLDSAGAAKISRDAAYSTHHLDQSFNLNNLLKYVLLP